MSTKIIADLERACDLYCGWYDHGNPAMDAGAMAYELVSAIRHAIYDLQQERENYWLRCPHCGWKFNEPNGSLVPTHDIGRCGKKCPGSRQAPRSMADMRPLWKDEQ